MSKVLGAVDWLNDRAGKAISFLIVFMVGVMTYEVVARYAFNAPTIWARETVQFLLGGYAVLGGAYVLRHRAHVSMDILYDRLSVRRRAILDLATSSFFFLFCGVLLWYGVDYAWSSFSVGETTGSTWNPPECIIKATIPLGALLILLQGLAKFVRDLVTAIRGAAPE